MYHLCLLLGFAGRYSMGGRGDLRAITMQTGEKIQRIRQTGGEILALLAAAGRRSARRDPAAIRGSSAGVSRPACAGFVLMVTLLVVLLCCCLDSGAGELAGDRGANAMNFYWGAAASFAVFIG